MTAEGLAHPTPFEIETAVAFLFFAEEKCDPVILEVGMGGITDATNLITHDRTCRACADQHGSSVLPWQHDRRDRGEKSRDHQTRLQRGNDRTGTGGTEGHKRTISHEAGTDLCAADISEAEVLEADLTGQRFLLQRRGIHAFTCQVPTRQRMQSLHWKPYASWMREAIIPRLEAAQGRTSGNPLERKTDHHPQRIRCLSWTEHTIRLRQICSRILYRKYFKDRRLFFIMGVFRDKDYPYIIQKALSIMQSRSLRSRHRIIRGHFPAEELAEAIRPCNPHVQRGETYCKSSRGTV